ncbi:MAG: hypothetical protein ACREBY_18200 [Polaromonas sp.]
MSMKFRKIWLAVAGTAALTLVGCGGGGGSSPAPTIPAASSIAGTAATGAALANAGVAITNSSGNSPCQEASITTTPLGSYTCTLKTGENAPFFIVVTDPTGNTEPLVSVTTTTPAAGTPLTTNVTPLTTAIVSQLANGNALALVSSKMVDAAALKQVTTNVLAQLASVLTALGVPAGYDPFTTSITAATASGTGNTADLVLDVVKVVTVTDPVTGKLALALSTVDNPAPIVLATATTPGSTVLPPAPGVSTLSQAAQIAAQAFTSCFALPTAQRVLAQNATVPTMQGGPEVTSVAVACLNLAANIGNAAGVDFLHNGYKAGQLMYGILTSDTMTGAKFSVPEIMAFYRAANTVSGKDEAVLNIRYIDANGNPGNVVTVARNIPNTSSTSRPTNWWLVGNQQPVDVTAKLLIRRVEQMNPANANQNKTSRFQTGIQFNVNAKGPGSINAGSPLKYARISGPGLPGDGAAGTGLVYVASSQGGQATMDLFNKTGSLTTGAQCGNGVTFDCPNLWFSRTKGITGADATTLTTNQPGIVWAQPADGIDPAKVVKGARYKVELFYGSNTTPSYTLHETLLSGLIQATQGVNLPWNTLGPQSLNALDPNGSVAGAQTALPVNWAQNIAAQQINGVAAVVDTFGSYGPSKAVPKGAISAVLDNVTVPAFNVVTPPSRTLLFSYRMLDTSRKTAAYIYN